MKLKILLATVIILFSPVAKIIAQDTHFSQFYTSPLLLNPAAAGTSERGFRAVMNYKNQWRSVASSAAYNTSAVAIDKTFLKNKTLGAGLTFYNDKAGNSRIQTNQANLIIASNKNLNEQNNISVGLQAGYVQKSIDYSALTWDNQYNGNAYDPALSSGETNQRPSIKYLDLATGLQWKLKVGARTKFITGVSLSHLTSPKNSFNGINTEKLSMRVTVYENVSIEFKNSNFTLLPGLLFQNQGTTKELLIGSLLRYSLGMDSRYTGVRTASAIYFGAYMRAKDSFIASFMFNYHNYFSMGMSYDITTSNLTTANSSKGGMEISLSVPVDGHVYPKKMNVKFE